MNLCKKGGFQRGSHLQQELFSKSAAYDLKTYG